MTSATDTYRLLRAFVDELARCGMRAACTSPGSRCAPLVLSLAHEPRLRCHSHLDERCSGFFALGLAKASGLPVAVACTSGTAAAELLPAAIEAREARVPLLLLTADRPPELRETGAGQTIDQLKLFGSAAKWFFEVGPLQGGSERLRWIRTLACRAYWTALEARPGVVHLNFPLHEPLVSDEPLGSDDTGRPGGAPYVRRLAAARGSGEGSAALRELVAGSRRGVLVAGRDERAGAGGEAAAAFCAAAGWPLLADPLSRARRGPAAVAHYDALLRDGAFAERMRPDLVLRTGDLPVSKALRGWLAGLGDVRQLVLDPEAAWQDPDSVLSVSLAIDPPAAFSELAPAVERAAVDEDWLAGWRSADELAAEAILSRLTPGELSEPAVAAELGVLLAAGATLFVASSMPVRDIETFWPVRSDPPRVLCNRGANGIDGTVSSAFGAAAAGDGPVVLLIGDVALAHDLGGLIAASRLDLRLTIVLLDNGGGGIFDFLPVSHAPMALADDPGGHGTPSAGHGEDERPNIYTRHIATPTGIEFARAGALYGLSHELVGDLPAFRAALERALVHDGSSIIEVSSDRAANVELHLRVWEGVSRAVSPPAGGAAPRA
ncbi:MAG: 2-succinyl-5-enolpyruvyl-6-hydroxy-3-cyclohexene-1-carboxylic-acid synthase [Solirubrobacteraceae bacterium]